MLIQMKVEGLLFDPRSGMYILLLKEIDGAQMLPIWIGKPEADSIALALGRVITPRPLTHDLLKNILTTLNVGVSRIVVTDIIDNTYYASLYLLNGSKEIPVDSRPSDAVAIALRLHVPIYVEDDILEKRHTDELEAWLKNLKPEDFGNIM
ncbi:MAG TPA: bifunctional nuclease family protein [Nitrospirae bacterium]|nr:bifunctional nuclease family protein [Nitrospirota bacterium]